MNFERNLRSFSSSQRLRFTVTCNKEPWHHVQSGKTSSPSSVHPIRSHRQNYSSLPKAEQKIDHAIDPRPLGCVCPSTVHGGSTTPCSAFSHRQWSENEPQIRLSKRFSSHHCSRQQRERPCGVYFTLQRPDSALGACFRGSINQISTQLLTCDNDPTHTHKTLTSTVCKSFPNEGQEKK